MTRKTAHCHTWPTQTWQTSNKASRPPSRMAIASSHPGFMALVSMHALINKGQDGKFLGVLLYTCANRRSVMSKQQYSAYCDDFGLRSALRPGKGATIPGIGGRRTSVCIATIQIVEGVPLVFAPPSTAKAVRRPRQFPLLPHFVLWSISVHYVLSPSLSGPVPLLYVFYVLTTSG